MLSKIKKNKLLTIFFIIIMGFFIYYIIHKINHPMIYGHSRPASTCSSNLGYITAIIDNNNANKETKAYIPNKYSSNEVYIICLLRKFNPDKYKESLYCPEDKNKDKCLSSYVFNPDINIEELPYDGEKGKQLLITEREYFHYGKRHSVLADFTQVYFTNKDEMEYLDELKRWRSKGIIVNLPDEK
jgi:hypothetical protein